MPLHRQQLRELRRPGPASANNEVTMNKPVLQPFIRTAFILFCLALLAGCGGTSKAIGPQRISLADIRLEEMRTLETTFLAGLRILNPSDIPIVIKGISCDLSVDGHYFASGLSPEENEIPPYGTTIISVPVYASTLDMVTSILQHAEEDASSEKKPALLRYELKGSLRLVRGESKTPHTVAFAVQGEMPLAGLRDQKTEPAREQTTPPPDAAVNPSPGQAQ